MNWWNNLSDFQQIMFVLATTATLLLIIFLVLMIIGASGDSDFDGGVDSDLDVDGINDEPISSFASLNLLSFRSFLAFFSIGGWVGFILDDVWPLGATIPVAILAGFTAALCVALAFRAMKKLENDGNVDYKNGIGKTAVIYLKIPANRKGSGKINATIQEKYLEINAVTDDEQDILVGSQVKIVDVLNETTVVVSAK